MANPNIVYILADDLGYGDLSCLNPDSRIHTPNHDRIAREGITFTDSHSNSAVCTPTRYGVLTGRYCWRSRLKAGVLWGYSPPLIENGRMTVASLLKQQNYTTACIGKWHLGLGWTTDPPVELTDQMHSDHHGIRFDQPLDAGPHTVGFDYSYVIPASLDMAPYCYIENGKVVEPQIRMSADSQRPKMWRGGATSIGFEHETCLLELTRRAEGFIADHASKYQDKPFFLYFPTPSPHTPHVPRTPFVGKSDAGNYGDFVIEHDWSVGQILNALDRHGLADNTLVIVTSDNGPHKEPLHLEEQFGHHSTYIYRGQKSDCWDGGHRIPFLARWPGHIPSGSVCDQTICLTDLLATVADMVDVRLPDEAGEDSISILPLLTGKVDQPVRDFVVHHGIDGDFAIRAGRWKLIACAHSGGWSLPANRVAADAPPMQLYDMHDDPREQHNLYHQRPDVVARLAAMLNRCRQSDDDTSPASRPT